MPFTWLDGKCDIPVLPWSDVQCRYDRITSQLIPGAMLAVAFPMIGYGLYVLATQNAPNS